MEVWSSALFSAVSSGVMVGIIVTIFKSKMDQNIENAKEANNLKFTSMVDKVEQVGRRLNGIEVKVDSVSGAVGRLNTKVEVVVTEQRHMMETVGNMRKEVEIALNLARENYGRVNRK